MEPPHFLATISSMLTTPAALPSKCSNASTTTLLSVPLQVACTTTKPQKPILLMRMSFCSCQVHGNGSYFDFDDKRKRSNGPITCIWASIAPSGKVNVSGRGLGSCLTYGSVVICGISHNSFGHDNGLSITRSAAQ